MAPIEYLGPWGANCFVKNRIWKSRFRLPLNGRKNLLAMKILFSLALYLIALFIQRNYLLNFGQLLYSILLILTPTLLLLLSCHLQVRFNSSLELKLYILIWQVSHWNEKNSWCNFFPSSDVREMQSPSLSAYLS